MVADQSPVSTWSSTTGPPNVSQDDVAIIDSSLTYGLMYNTYLRTATGTAGTARADACPAAASCRDNSVVPSQSIFRLDERIVRPRRSPWSCCVLSA